MRAGGRIRVACGRVIAMTKLAGWSATKASARAGWSWAGFLPAARTSLRLIRISGYCGAPPRFLQSARNFLRALPCRPLASACCEHALETASLSVGLGVPGGDEVCAHALARVIAMANDRMAAQDATDRIRLLLWNPSSGDAGQCPSGVCGPLKGTRPDASRAPRRGKHSALAVLCRASQTEQYYEHK